jgi:type IV pilus assembly protein PilW
MTGRRRQPGATFRSEHGFSLTELLVAMVILALVTLGLVTLLNSGQQSFLTGSNQVESQENLRSALDRIAGDIRSAGYDPTGAGFAPLVNTGGAGMPTATAFRIQNDLDGNGVVTDPGERIDYVINGALLQRQAIGVDAAPQTVIGGINLTGVAAAFQYSDAAGANPGSEALIRTVVVTLQTRPSNTQPTAWKTGLVFVRMTDTVRLRNRLL